MSETLITESFLSDHIQIFYRLRVKKDARAAFVIVHGHGEHSGRYEKFFQHFESWPVHLAIYDLRGNGRSGGAPGDIDSFEDYLKDLSAFVQILRRSHGLSEPLILFGHSLGGLITLHWALRNQEGIQALILSSPCLGFKVPLMAKIINPLLMRYFPDFCYNRPVRPEDLSHLAAEVLKYRTDPLIRRKISARLLHEMRTACAALRSLPLRFKFPIAVLAAEMDRVVDLNITREIYERIESPKKSLKLFTGFYHEIFNEKNQGEAFQALKKSLAEAGLPPL